MTAHAWTVEEACAYFADGGAPVDPHRLREIIRHLQWKPAGWTPSPGPQGGRGKPLYPITDFMRLHAFVLPWLMAQDPGPGT